MTEWVSVKDKLPNDNERYLTCDEDGFIAVFYFFPFDRTFANDDVTYWMPLPEPPK